jgi:serine/threonine protein kinase
MNFINKKNILNILMTIFLYFIENHINNYYMLVMEYADSGTLRNYLKKNFSKLTWDDRYLMAYQLASAVSCLHSEGIVHRDLVINFIIIQSFNCIIFRYLFNTHIHFLIALW